VMPAAPRIPPWYYVNPLTGLTSAMAMQNMPVNIPIPIPFLGTNLGVQDQTPLWRVQIELVAGGTVALFLISWLLLDPRPLGRRRRAAPPDPAGAA